MPKHATTPAIRIRTGRAVQTFKASDEPAHGGRDAGLAADGARLAAAVSATFAAGRARAHASIISCRLARSVCVMLSVFQRLLRQTINS